MTEITDFIDRITERRHRMSDAIEELKNTRYPIVLVGAGGMACRVAEVLKSQGISIDIVAVHKKYIKVIPAYKKIPLSVLEETVLLKEKYNYIIGFVEGVNEGELLNAANVYHFDISHAGFYEGSYTIPYHYYLQNSGQLNSVSDMLEDELSRKILAAFINQVISGNYDYLKPYKKLPEYFPSDIIKRTQPEIFVDGGAYTGDTISSYINNYELDAHTMGDVIHAFEPDQNNFAKCKENFSGIGNIHLNNRALWSECAQLTFTNSEDTFSHVSTQFSGGGGN